MRERTGCFTGHRQIPEKDYAVIEEKLEQTIVKLYNNGIIRYCAGGALGFYFSPRALTSPGRAARN